MISQTEDALGLDDVGAELALVALVVVYDEYAPHPVFERMVGADPMLS